MHTFPNMLESNHLNMMCVGFLPMQSVGVSDMQTCRGSCCVWSWTRSVKVWVSAWRETGIVPVSAFLWWDSILEDQQLETDASGSETSYWR